MSLDSLAMISWLIAAVVVSWALPRRWQMPASIATTVAFLVSVDGTSACLLTSFAFLAYLLPRRAGFRPRALFAVFMVVVLTFVGFKTAHRLTPSYALPLGLSFYSFRVIHYLFEGYKGKLPEHGLLDVLAYLFFLPTLIVGPIHRFPQFKRDLEARNLAGVDVSAALERILYGYVKIVFLGNYLVAVKLEVALRAVTEGPAWIVAYASAFREWANLYLLFSGYADVAIGFAALMGFRIIENFDRPFLATNLGEFWQRWHISLSSFIRDYVYAPVAAATGGASWPSSSPWCCLDYGMSSHSPTSCGASITVSASWSGTSFKRSSVGMPCCGPWTKAVYSPCVPGS